MQEVADNMQVHRFYEELTKMLPSVMPKDQVKIMKKKF
jgi:hypothetical protein